MGICKQLIDVSANPNFGYWHIMFYPALFTVRTNTDG